MLRNGGGKELKMNQKNENITFSCLTRETIVQMGKEIEGVQMAVDLRDNRPRIYFSYHPEDFHHLDRIARLILKKVDGVLFYYDYKANGEPDADELKGMLHDMQLFVIPVTSHFAAV